MEVILIKDVEKLGVRNDLVKVKPGYARNYLIPKGFAVVANSSNRKTMENNLKHEAARIEALQSRYEDVKAALEGATIKVGAKVGETDKIFGSVTTIQVAEAIKNQKSVEVDRKVIVLNEDIKTLGTYPATITLNKDLNFDINVEVVAE